jgi:hypothetical protein
MAHLYWGETSAITVISSRASLAARLLAGAAPAVRDPFGACWLAFAECHQGLATAHAGVEVLPADARLEVTPGVGAEVVAGRARSWTFSAPPPTGILDVIGQVRDDIATSVHRVLHDPAPERLVGLTGGRDSRTILAVMLEEAVAGAFEFETYGAADLPDVRVAEDLASRLGLRHRRGGSRSGAASRAARIAALRAGAFRDVSERELAMRLQVGAGCGMHNLMHPARAHPAPGDQVLVSGYCGEGLRTNYAGAQWIRRREHAQQFPYRGLKLGQAEIVKPEPMERYVGELHRLINHDIVDDDPPRDLVDAWYLRNRFRRWLGPEQELNPVNAVYPLYSVIGIRAANAVGPEDRWADRIPYEIIRRSAPTLVDVPFQDRGGTSACADRNPQCAPRSGPPSGRPPAVLTHRRGPMSRR